MMSGKLANLNTCIYLDIHFLFVLVIYYLLLLSYLFLCTMSSIKAQICKELVMGISLLNHVL